MINIVAACNQIGHIYVCARPAIRITPAGGWERSSLFSLLSSSPPRPLSFVSPSFALPVNSPIAGVPLEAMRFEVAGGYREVR